MGKVQTFLYCGIGASLLLAVLTLAAVFAGWRAGAGGLVVVDFFVGALLLVRLARLLDGGVRRLLAQIRDTAEGRRESCDLRDDLPALRDAGEAVNAFATGMRQKQRAEREGLQRALQASGAVIESIPQGAALISPDGHVEIANRAAARFGLLPGGPMGSGVPKGIAALVSHTLAAARLTAPPPPPPPPAATPAAAHAPLTSPGGDGVPPSSPGAREMVQLFADGNELFFLPQAHPIFGDRGQVIGVVLVLVDVTAERQMDEARSGLISSVSHQLKTPMTSIQMSIYLLLEDAADRLTSRQIELLHAARDDSDRLLRLIEDLLSTARERRGQATPSPDLPPDSFSSAAASG